MASRGHAFLMRLERLGTATLAVGFAGAVVASRVAPRPAEGSLNQTRRLLHQVQQDVRAARVIGANPALRMSVGQIEATPPEIERITAASDHRALRALDQEICAPAEAAVVFLATGVVYESASGTDGSITLEVTGNDGAQQFTFASGTAQADIITAINSFTTALGVVAAESEIDPARVSVTSTTMDSDAFVRIREVDGPPEDIIYTDAESTIALDDYKDFGSNAITLSAWRP
jgi:hypothetical protein